MNLTYWWNTKILTQRDDALLRRLWLYHTATYSTLLSVVLSVAFIVWNWNALPPAVPLWYSKPWGFDRLAHPLWLFLLPAASIFVYIINVFVSTRLEREHQTFIKILSLAATLTSTLNAIIMIKILSLVR